jgi:hypothetical protein
VIEQCRRDANLRGDGRALGLIGYATAVLNNGLDATMPLSPARRRRVPRTWASGGRGRAIEAAAPGARDSNAALKELKRAPVPARAGGSVCWTGRRRCSATARPPYLYRESIGRLDRCGSSFTPRACLVYGEWLRRGTGAPMQVAAHRFALLSDVGGAFAEQARRELWRPARRFASGPVRATRSPHRKRRSPGWRRRSPVRDRRPPFRGPRTAVPPAQGVRQASITRAQLVAHCGHPRNGSFGLVIAGPESRMPPGGKRLGVRPGSSTDSIRPPSGDRALPTSPTRRAA